MDDNQSTQQSSQQRHDLQLARARRRGSPRSSAWNSLVALLLSPWLLWPLLWLILLLAASVSIFSLTFTGFSDRPNSVPQVAPVPAVNSDSDHIAIWVIGAIVVCAAGYWVVLRQLQDSSPPQRQRRAKRSRKRLPQKLRSRVKSTIVEPTTSTPTPEPSVTFTESVAEPPIINSREPQNSTPPIADIPEPFSGSDSNGSSVDPQVTILPPEEVESVDVEKVSLAEMMDIRKHRPLSSILGKTYDEE